MTEPNSSSPLSESHLGDRARELRDLGRCPACLEPLTSLVCGRCGLNLDDPLAHELAAASEAAAKALDQRAAVIARMRAAAAAAASPSPAVAPDAATTPDAAAAEPVVTAVPASEAPASPSPPAAAAPHPAPAAPAAPRRSSVQIALVVIGVTLLSTFAVFGLVYAFINYGVIARSLIVGAVTVAAIVVATVLRRRGLTSTAEGIAALGALLVVLDAWAIRENDFFGVESADVALYWGAALASCAAIFVGWSRVARLRIPSIAGHALVAPAVFVFGLGFTTDVVEIDDQALRTYTAAVAGIVAALAHRLLIPRDATQPGRAGVAERILMTVGALLLGLVATIAGGLVAIDEPGGEFLGAIALLGVAGALAALAATLLSVPQARAATRAFASIAVGGTVAVLIVTPLNAAARDDNLELAFSGPLLVAAVLALVGELILRRIRTNVRNTAMVGVIVAISLGSVAALIALVIATFAVATQFALLGSEGVTLGTPADAVERESVASILALAGVVVLAAALWSIDKLLARRRAALVGGAVLVAALAAPLALVHGVVLLLWWVIAGAAIAVLVVRRGHREPARLSLAGGALLGATLAYLASWTTPEAWITSSVLTLVALGVARWLIRGDSRVLPDALILVITGVLAAALVREFSELRLGVVLNTGTAAAVAAVAALAIVLCASLPPRILSAVERRALFWIATGTGIAAMMVTTGIGGVNREYAEALQLMAAAGAAMLIGLNVWVFRRATLPFFPERFVAAILLPGIAAAIVWPLAASARLAEGLIALSVEFALLAAAIAGLVFAIGENARLRLASDLGIAAIATVALAAPIADPRVEPWIVLLPAALIALVIAISPEGLFESRAPRAQVGWVALALGAAALWSRLWQTDTMQVEPYTLPVAGAVLLTAALIHWRAPRREPAVAPPSVAYLVAASLLLALVPSAIVTTDATPARTLVVALAAMAALALGAVAGSDSSRIGTRADRFVGYLVGSVTITALLAGSIGSSPAALDPIGIGSVAALATISLLVFVVPPAHGARTLSWVAFGIGALGGAILIAMEVADPLEWVTVPLAAALLLRGAIVLRRRAAARSLPHLGPGLAVLLLPSLLAAYENDPLWRLIGIGVAAFGVLAVGLFARLQAPFLLGGGVLLWHLVTQFWNELALVYNAVPWWVWVGIAGALLIAAAIRYEQRLNNLKTVARSIRQLR